MPAVKINPMPIEPPPMKALKPKPKIKTLAGTVVNAPDALRAAILNDYQTAVTYMQQGNFSAAHPALEKLLTEAPPEFTDRIRMYLAACIAQSARGKAAFKTPEEQYDFAVSLLNDRQFEDARHHLDQILSGKADADYAFYGLALLASMTGDASTCLEKLQEAIRLNARNRILARSDPDFLEMADDPRFTELLYPDLSADA